MPRQRFEADDPREWLARARGNLALARKIAPDIELEDLCFNAQQAAEKALKGVLLQASADFPYSHSIGRLLMRIAEAGLSLPANVAEADELTPYAVAARYPLPPDEAVTYQDYERAVALADAVVQWAAAQIGG